MGDTRRKDIGLHGGRPVDPDQTTEEVLNRLKGMEEKLGLTNPRIRRSRSVTPAETAPSRKSVFDIIRED